MTRDTTDKAGDEYTYVLYTMSIAFQVDCEMTQVMISVGCEMVPYLKRFLYHSSKYNIFSYRSCNWCRCVVKGIPLQENLYTGFPVLDVHLKSLEVELQSKFTFCFFKACEVRRCPVMRFLPQNRLQYYNIWLCTYSRNSSWKWKPNLVILYVKAAPTPKSRGDKFLRTIYDLLGNIHSWESVK